MLKSAVLVAPLTCIAEALLRREELSSLERPEPSPFNGFKAWFRRDPPGLWAIGFYLLHDEEDMITLGSQSDSDEMSSFVHQCLGYPLRKFRKTPNSWKLGFLLTRGKSCAHRGNYRHCHFGSAAGGSNHDAAFCEADQCSTWPGGGLYVPFRGFYHAFEACEEGGSVWNYCCVSDTLLAGSEHS